MSMKFKSKVQETWEGAKANPGKTVFNIVGAACILGAATMCGERKAKALLWVAGSEFLILGIKDIHDQYCKKGKEEGTCPTDTMYGTAS